jgi:multiple sugar transport system substrate-binding protein
MRVTSTGRRTIGVTAALLAGALTLAGCAGGGSSSGGSSGGGNASASNCFLSGQNKDSNGTSATGGGKVTISFMEAMSGGAQKPALQHLTDEFTQANPDITVNLEPSPDYATLNQNETNAVSAKKPPTIGQAYEGEAAQFANSGVIDPLDGYDQGGSAQSALYKGVQSDLKLCDGKTWMWPFGKSDYVSFYNPNLLTGAGMSTPPATWDQYADALKKVSKNGVTGISIDPGGVGSITSGEIWFEILSQADGTPVFDKNGVPQFDGAGVQKALTYLSDLKKAGALATGKNYPGETALGAGKGLFDISSVAGYSYEQKAVGTRFQMGTADLPAGPAGKANQMNGANIVMFTGASAAEKQAAWKYMSFLSSASSQAYWATQTGYLPVTPQALSQMTSFTSSNPWMVTGANALADAAGTAPVPWADKAQSELAVALTSVLQSGADPKAALSKAQTAAMADMKADQ